jgi:hypothetical protein
LLDASADAQLSQYATSRTQASRVCRLEHSNLKNPGIISSRVNGRSVKILVRSPEDPLSTGCRYYEPSTMRDRFHWARLLAFVTGLVNQELLIRNEYLIAENRILRAQLPTRLRLSDPERATLTEIAKRLGCKALHEVTQVAKPDTILGWYRRLIARKFDGSRHRVYPGRPRLPTELEALVVRFVRETL